MKTSLLLALGASLLLTGCGEYPQIAKYEKGQYQGKTDTRPWEGGQFQGDRTAWQNALANRNQAQNEYKRTQ